MVEGAKVRGVRVARWTIVGLLAMFWLAPATIAGTGYRLGLTSMGAITSIDVRINEHIENQGISADVLHRAALASLIRNRVPYDLKHGESGLPELNVYVRALPVGDSDAPAGHSYMAWVELNRRVRVSPTHWVGMVSWSGTALNHCSAEELRRCLRERVMEVVDTFSQDYLEANTPEARAVFAGTPREAAGVGPSTSR